MRPGLTVTFVNSKISWVVFAVLTLRILNPSRTKVSWFNRSYSEKYYSYKDNFLSPESMKDITCVGLEINTLEQ